MLAESWAALGLGVLLGLIGCIAGQVLMDRLTNALNDRIEWRARQMLEEMEDEPKPPKDAGYRLRRKDDRE